MAGTRTRSRSDHGLTVLIAVVVSVVIMLLGLLAPYLPVTGNPREPVDLMQRALGFEALQSVPGWWSTVLPAVTALAAVDAARRQVDVRRPVAASAGWWLLGVLLAWLSFDHGVTIHEALGRLDAPWMLPGHPVETVLVPLGLLAGVLLARSQGLAVISWLAVAAVLYGASALVDARGAPMAMSTHHASMVEEGLSWAGLLAALLATTWAAQGRDLGAGAGPDDQLAQQQQQQDAVASSGPATVTAQHPVPVVRPSGVEPE